MCPTTAGYQACYVSDRKTAVFHGAHIGFHGAKHEFGDRRE